MDWKLEQSYMLGLHKETLCNIMEQSYMFGLHKKLFVILCFKTKVTMSCHMTRVEIISCLLYCLPVPYYI